MGCRCQQGGHLRHAFAIIHACVQYAASLMHKSAAPLAVQHQAGSREQCIQETDTARLLRPDLYCGSDTYLHLQEACPGALPCQQLPQDDLHQTHGSNSSPVQHRLPTLVCSAADAAISISKSAGITVHTAAVQLIYGFWSAGLQQKIRERTPKA